MMIQASDDNTPRSSSPVLEPDESKFFARVDAYPSIKLLCDHNAPLKDGCGVLYRGTDGVWRIGRVSSLRPLRVNGRRAKRADVAYVVAVHRSLFDDDGKSIPKRSWREFKAVWEMLGGDPERSA